MSITYQGTVAGYITLGNNQLLQNLFVFENGIASRVNAYIRRLIVQNDPVAALATVMPIVRTSRVVGSAIGGILMSKCPFDTTMTSSGEIKIRTTTSFGNQITETEGLNVWGKYTIRPHDLTGQIMSPDAPMLSEIVADTGSEYILKPGESLLVQVRGAAVTSNPSIGNDWFMQVMWEEDSLPIFNISGTVTLNSTPVSGAKVIVMQAYD